MNRKIAETIRTEMKAACDAIAARHGLQVRITRSTYGEDTGNFNFKAECQQVGVLPLALREAAEMFGLDLNRKANFPNAGGECSLVDYRPRAHMRPYVIRNAVGREFALTPAAARAYFGTQSCAS